MDTADAGRYAEQFVARYLELSGYKVFARNFSVRNVGEIDIAAEKNGIIYSVEVKGRRRKNLFAGPEGLVSSGKISRLTKTTALLLDEYGLNKRNCKIVMAFVHIADNDFHNSITFYALK